MALDLQQWSIIAPALLAGLLVLATHVPLGMEVLARGIIFIDLAIAQVAGLGVIGAGAAGLEPHGVGVHVAAVSAALAAAVALMWSERRWPEVQEAVIGVLFVIAATAGILLLAKNPHAGEHLKDLLVGQILWVNYSQLIPVALLTAVIAGLWLGLGPRLGRLGFYVVFALAVTLSVQLVGVYLVFASLIVPALATRHFARHRLTAGYALGAAGYGLGLIVSAALDLPSGAVIVWTMTLIGVGCYALAASRVLESFNRERNP
ncbi:MAG TPA: metal ABC transporter permease [Burkholderiales bacterium]|nr:metal ABC transporter permease [Burkholderiales bacterium]